MTHYENEEEDLLSYFEQMLTEGELSGKDPNDLETPSIEELSQKEEVQQSLPNKELQYEDRSKETEIKSELAQDLDEVGVEIDPQDLKQVQIEEKVVPDEDEVKPSLNQEPAQEIDEVHDSRQLDETSVFETKSVDKSSLAPEVATKTIDDHQVEENIEAKAELLVGSPVQDNEACVPPQVEPCVQMDLKKEPLPVRTTPSLQSLLESLHDDTESTTTKTEIAIEAKVDTKTQVESETKVESKSKVDPEVEPKTKVEAETKVASKIETEIKLDTKTEAETKVKETQVEELPLEAVKPEVSTNTLEVRDTTKDLELPKAETVSASEVATQVVTSPQVESLKVKNEIQEELTQNAQALSKVADKPLALNWHNLELPDEFQVLFFLVKGVRFAVPLVNLGGIFEVPKLTKIAGRPGWYKGMADVRGSKLSVVDTMRWVNPEDARDHDYQYMIVLDNSAWALGCDVLEGNRVLRGDQIKFRQKAGSRPWLAGIVKKEMCALLHVTALTAMFERGMGLSTPNAVEP